MKALIIIDVDDPNLVTADVKIRDKWSGDVLAIYERMPVTRPITFSKEDLEEEAKYGFKALKLWNSHVKQILGEDDGETD